MVTRVDKKPIIYNTTLIRVWKPAVVAQSKKTLEILQGTAAGHNIPKASMRDILDDYEDIEYSLRMFGVDYPAFDLFSDYDDDDGDEAIRIARMCLMKADSVRKSFKNISLMEFVTSIQQDIFSKCDRVYYGTEAVYQLLNRSVNGLVLNPTAAPSYRSWCEDTAVRAMVTQAPYMLIHPTAVNDLMKSYKRDTHIEQWHAWDMYKRLEALGLRTTSRRNLLAHAYAYGINKRGFEPSDNPSDDFQIDLQGTVDAKEGVELFIVLGVKYIICDGIGFCLSGDDCINLATMAQCYYRTSMYFSMSNGFNASANRQAVGLIKDILNHACRLIDLGKNFSNIIRSMHILAQGDFNDIYEEKLGINLGWGGRSENYVMESRELDPMGLTFHRRALSLARDEIDKLNVGFIYHVFVGDEMLIDDLRHKVANMPSKVMPADSDEWSSFIKFTKAYLLSRFMFTHKKKPSAAGDIKLLNDDWAHSCISGRFKMPPRSEWGKVWIQGEFSYTQFADTWHLDAQDVSYVVKDSAGLRDGKYRNNREINSELLMAMTCGNTLDILTGSTPKSARDRICEGKKVSEVVLTTAPKAENAKPSWKKRVTFAADNEFRKMQAEYDRNCRKVMSFLRGPSLGVDQCILEKQFHDIANSTALGTEGGICSHDISAWSESMDRDRKFEFEDVLIKMINKPEMINIKLDWSVIKATVFKQGAKDIVALDNGSFQGFDGSASSILHSMILLYCIDTARRKSIIDKNVRTNMATLIDDCIALMKGLVTEDAANAFWIHLKDIYLKLGFVVDDLKSIFSSIKAIYLSRRFLLGAEVPSDFKVFIKAHSSYEDPLRCSLDAPADIFGAMRGAADANGNVWYIYYCALVSSLAEIASYNPCVTKIPPAAAAIFAIAPKVENGWGFPSIVDWCTNDVTDKRSHFNSILESLAVNATSDPLYHGSVDMFPRSVGQAIWALKCQAWRIVSYSNIFTNPFEATREGPLKPDMLKRNAIQDILAEVATASPWKDLLAWNSSNTTNRVRELLINSGPLHAPTIAALVNCMPDNYRLSLLGKAIGSTSLLDLLPKGARSTLKRRVVRCASSYFMFSESIYRMTKEEYSAEDFAVLTYLERTQTERDEFYTANGVNMIDHTFPDPIGSFAHTKANLKCCFSPNGSGLRIWNPEFVTPTRTNQYISGKGIYIPRRSGRVWEVTSEYAKGWDTVSQRIAMGLAILARAEADGHGTDGLLLYFIRSWNELSNITPRDTHLISIHGSIKRLDANPGSAVHPIICHRNILLGFNNRLKPALDALATKAKEITGNTAHLHDYLAHETCILALTALHYSIYVMLEVSNDELSHNLGIRPDCVCTESTKRMTTNCVADLIEIEIMESESNYGLLQACPELVSEIGIPTMKASWVKMINALVDGDYSAVEELRNQMVSNDVDSTILALKDQEEVYLSSVILASEPAARSSITPSDRALYTMRPQEEDQRARGDAYTLSVNTMSSKFSRALSIEQPDHISCAIVIRSIVWSRLKGIGHLNLAKHLYMDPDANMTELARAGSADFWRAAVIEVSKVKKSKCLSEATMNGFKALGISGIHIRSSNDVKDVTQSVASYFGARLKEVVSIISENIKSVAGRSSTDFERPLMEKIVTNNPALLNTKMRKEHMEKLIAFNKRTLHDRLEAIINKNISHRGDQRAVKMNEHGRIVELRCRSYVYKFFSVTECGRAVLDADSYCSFIKDCAERVSSRYQVHIELLPAPPISFEDSLTYTENVQDILDKTPHSHGWDAYNGNIGSRFAYDQVMRDSDNVFRTQFAVSAAEIAPRIYKRIITSSVEVDYPAVEYEEASSCDFFGGGGSDDGEGWLGIDDELDRMEISAKAKKLPIPAWQALYTMIYTGNYDPEYVNDSIGCSLPNKVETSDLREAHLEDFTDEEVFTAFPTLFGDYLGSGQVFEHEWLNRDEADAYTTEELGRSFGGSLF